MSLLAAALTAAAALLLAAPLPAAVERDFDSVAAVPTHNGHADQRLLPWLRTASLGPDGRVQLRLERRFDWVLLLVDSHAPPEERVVGYVTYAAPAAGGRGDVELRLSRATLQELARRDDGYRNAVNLYLNHDRTLGSWYVARPRQVWRGGGLEPTVNRTPSPGAYRFAGFGVDMTLAHPRVSARDLCEGTAAIGLFPPVPVTSVGERRFDSSRGINTAASNADAGARCKLGDVQVNSPRPGVTALRFPAGESLLAELPAGWWTLMRPHTGEVLAHLEMAVDPPVSAGGHTLVFVPLPRLVLTDAGRRVSHIAVDWVRYDVVRQRYVTADPEAMSALVHESYLELEVTGAGRALAARVGAHAPQPIRAVGAHRLSDPRKVAGPGTPGGVITLTVGYEMQGVAYRFTWDGRE